MFMWVWTNILFFSWFQQHELGLQDAIGRACLWYKFNYPSNFCEDIQDGKRGYLLSSQIHRFNKWDSFEVNFTNNCTFKIFHLIFNFQFFVLGKVATHLILGSLLITKQSKHQENHKAIFPSFLLWKKRTALCEGCFLCPCTNILVSLICFTLTVVFSLWMHDAYPKCEQERFNAETRIYEHCWRMFLFEFTIIELSKSTPSS